MKVTKSQSHKVTSKKIRQVFFSFVLFFSFSLLVTGDLAFADQIRIRTIITPVGSQSEKWGAAGLMVCIGGEPINVGGCGEADVNASNVLGNPITIDNDGTDKGHMIFFKDEDDNHQFADDFGTPKDTVYWVQQPSGGGAICISLKCFATGRSDTSVAIDSCTPPSCPISGDWTDYGIGCAGTGVGTWGGDMYAVGYCERWCCKD